MVCTPIRRGLPFARARRRGLRSMSGRYSYGIDNPPTLRRSSFPQRVVRPIGVPYCKTRLGIPRDPHARRAQPALQSGRPSATLRVALSTAVRPPLPKKSYDFSGTPICPLGTGYAVPKRGLNGAYKVSQTHLPPLPPLPRNGGGGSCPTYCLLYFGAWQVPTAMDSMEIVSYKVLARWQHSFSPQRRGTMVRVSKHFWGC